jgi:hypothetical protein
MSASAEIFRFPGRAASGNSGSWSNQDIADVYRCLDQFARHGLVVEAASGLSDEGDPWFAIEDVSSGDALVHIARIDGFFVVHVLDGETWSGDTLRQALSNIEVSLLAGIGSVDHHAATAADGDDDKDGTHAFLRIVSAVVAVLTADVIANAVTHEAVASPLPPSGAPDAGDHGSDASKAVLDLPAVDSSLAAQHREQPDTTIADPASVETAIASKSESAEASVSTAAAGVPVSVPVEKTQSALTDTVPDVGGPHTGTKQEIMVAAGQSEGVALSYALGDEHVQVTFEDRVSFVGTEKKSDMFLIVLDGHTKDLTAKVENFDKGKDSLVIEKSDESGTSSAIVTDLGALVANGESYLTVIGQATVEIHLTSQPGSLVAGG